MRASLIGAALLSLTIPGFTQDLKPGYVGSEACAVCHEDLAGAFKKTRHQALELEKKRGWAGQSCEACHGPGAKHAESADIAEILNPGKQKPIVQNRDCLKCHVNQTARVGRIVSGHAREEVACSQCHSVHPKPGEVLFERRAERINRLCYGCHQTVQASFQKPHTHPVNQHAMSCTDCHNPHNPTGVAAQRVAFGNEPNCFSCHANLRGPFVFEHAPVRLEGCQSCHEPHGSINPKMLTRHDVKVQCLECHADLGAASARSTGVLGGVPPAFHDLRSPRFQTCTTCHRKIHGSHVDRSLQR